MMLALALAAGAVAAPALAPSAGGGDSIYALESTWTDQAGKSMKLEALAGEPVLVAMIYTTCRAACPLTVQDMKAVERRLDPATRAKVRFVLVSFDPKRDTPAALLKLAKGDGLDLARWTLLTGRDDDVRELAAVLGMKFRAAGAQFVHSSIISVLDAQGVIREQTAGVKQDPAGNARLLTGLVQGKSAPTARDAGAPPTRAARGE